MKKLICLLFLFGVFFSLDTNAMDFDDPPFEKKVVVNETVCTLKSTKMNTGHFFVVITNDGGKLLMKGNAIDQEGDNKQGIWKFYYSNGQLQSEGEYRDNIKIGPWKRFNSDGTPKVERYYSEERYKMLVKMNQAKD